MNEFLLPAGMIDALTNAGIMLPVLAGLLAGCLIAGGIALLLVAMYVKRRSETGNGPPSRSERISGVDPLTTGENVRELIEELDRLAGRIDERIEQRMAQLEGLLANADAKIARVDAEILAANGRAEGTTGIAGSYEAVPAPGSSLRDAPPTPSAGSADKMDPLYEEILRLSGQGLDPIEIARRVEMNVGEVELVLNLHLPGRRVE